MPCETKMWSQYWYPIQKLGPAQYANLDAVVSLLVQGNQARAGVAVARAFPQARIALLAEGKSVDELCITGLNLEQYRHATRGADAYWREALRRDAGDARCNNALSQKAAARRLLASVLAREPNHVLAADLADEQYA